MSEHTKHLCKLKSLIVLIIVVTGNNIQINQDFHQAFAD